MVHKIFFHLNKERHLLFTDQINKSKCRWLILHLSAKIVEFKRIQTFSLFNIHDVIFNNAQSIYATHFLPCHIRYCSFLFNDSQLFFKNMRIKSDLRWEIFFNRISSTHELKILGLYTLTSFNLLFYQRIIIMVLAHVILCILLTWKQ